jgi:glycerol kinase
VAPDATIQHVEYRWFPPDVPFPGLVEFDAARLAELVLNAAHEALHASGDPSIDSVGITNQRASTVLWDRGTGVPVAPAIGWQDLRTVGVPVAKAETRPAASGAQPVRHQDQWPLAGARQATPATSASASTWLA